MFAILILLELTWEGLITIWFNRKQGKNIFLVDYAVMLRQSWRKRHLINLPPPPKKKWPFLGGVRFLEYFHEFLGLEHKKNFGKNLGQSRCFGIIIGRFRPLLAIL